MDQFLPNKRVTILMITEDDEIFTGTAYLAKVDVTHYKYFSPFIKLCHDDLEITQWELRLTGSGMPAWIPINTKLGKRALATVASWFTAILNREE